MKTSKNLTNSVTNRTKTVTIISPGTRRIIMKKCDPKHRHRKSVRATIPRLDDLVGRKMGLFIEPAVIDPEVGEELIFFLRGNKPTIEKILGIDPSQLILEMNAGFKTNPHGLVAFIVFWVRDAKDISETPIASSITFFNPNKKSEVSFWRRLADAGHWHLFLMVGNKMRNIIDYNNKRDKFELHKKIDMVIGRSSGIPTGDFDKARKLFLKEYPIDVHINTSQAKFGNFPSSMFVMH